jgi:sugar diacid utilization regulator/putative methionine-R-sulfoxide reductase with GAF domain
MHAVEPTTQRSPATVQPPFASCIERGLAAVAEQVVAWFAGLFSAPVGLVRKDTQAGGSAVLVGPRSGDQVRFSALAAEVRDNNSLLAAEGMIIDLGQTAFALIVLDRVPDSEVEFSAIHLSSAGLALQAAEAIDQSKMLMRELTALHEVSSKILTIHDLNQVLLSIANEILGLLDADMAGVLLLGDDDELFMRCCVGNLSTETARLSMERGQGLAGRVLETRSPCKVDQYLKSASITHDFDPLARAERTRSALGAPLLAHGEVIGVLEVWRRRRGAFSDADVERLVALTNLASIAIENARLFDQAHEGLVRVAQAEDALSRQVETLQRSAELQQTFSGLLLDGEGLPAIAKVIGKELGAEVAIVSHELWHLAGYPRDLNFADIQSDVTRLTRRTTDGIATVALSNRPGWLTVGAIVAGSERFGWICVVANEPPSGIVDIALNGAMLHAALWHLQARAAEEANIETTDKILWDLLDGSVEHRHSAAARALQMRIDLRKEHRVFVGRVQGLDEYAADQGWDGADLDRFRRATSSGVRRILEQITGAELVAMRADVIAAIVPNPKDVRTVIQALLSTAVPAPLTTRWGVSGTHSDPDQLGSAHAEARGALHVAGRLGNGQLSAVFDELDLLRFLIGPRDEADLEQFVHQVIGPLIVADLARTSDLVKTLRGYLDANCSQAEAAQRLFVHYKTMRYRLERIQQLTGLDLHRHADRVRADLALRIHELATPR